MNTKICFTAKEDVMAANNKSQAQFRELLVVLTHYGVVVDYEAERKAENAEYQTKINALQSELDAIKEQKLSADEFEIIKAYRVQVAKHNAEKDKIIAEKNKQLQDVTRECDAKLAKVKQAIGV